MRSHSLSVTQENGDGDDDHHHRILMNQTTIKKKRILTSYAISFLCKLFLVHMRVLCRPDTMHTSLFEFCT